MGDKHFAAEVELYAEYSGNLVKFNWGYLSMTRIKIIYELLSMRKMRKYDYGLYMFNSVIFQL